MAAAAATVVEVAHRHTEERRVASTGISVWPSHDHEGREAGYEARHSYAIACPDLATAGALLGELPGEVGDALAIDGVALEVTEDHGAGAPGPRGRLPRRARAGRPAGRGWPARDSAPCRRSSRAMPTGARSPMPQDGAGPRVRQVASSRARRRSTTTVTVVWELAY